MYNFASKINNFQNIGQFLAKEASIWPIFLSKSLEIWSIISSQTPFLTKVRSQAPNFTAIYPLTSPPSLKIWAAHTCEKNVECPPPPGPGFFSLKGVTGMSGARDTLFMLPQPLHKTPFSAFFSTTWPHFNPKIQNFPIFCSRCQN